MAGTLLKTAAVLLGAANVAVAQMPGKETPEVHPQLTTYKCTTSGGCVSQQTSVVLDWNYRWIHDANYTSCTANGGVNPTICPDAKSCDANCFVEGADYAAAGIKTSGNVLTMNQYVKTNGTYNSASPRIYLLGPDGKYEMLKLNGQELTFDVDLSTLPCGENGALYLSEMSPDGGRSGGANYGSGYCDAQCPVQTWLNGTLNTNNAPFCCNEMDILEANSRANAFTPHPCTTNDCDKGGCGFNPYNQGLTNYWAPGGTLDTSKPFTVTTKFITSDGSQTGSLVNITRVYIQNGVQVKSAVTTGDTIQASACPSGAAYGGLKTMGEALGRGMVLALSIWNDQSGFMNWLDSGSNGPCSATEGNPANIVAQEPDTHVVFSNIRWGDLGSTTNSRGGSGPSSSITTVKTATKTATSVAPGPTCTAKHYEQCGGIDFKGCKQCDSGLTCQVANDWYSQCL